jgi:RNA polymerase sigma factor (sigma-70 family)
MSMSLDEGMTSPMEETEWLAERFEQHRPRLRALAYRMLGSLAEADDAVQDAWLRLCRSDADEIDNLSGWLTTVVARECLHTLRSRRQRREESRLPEPVVILDSDLDPEQEALLADSVGLALLVVLDRLGPAERLAFVLHDMFELPFDEIAEIVGRTPAAARQLASRARRRVNGAEISSPDPDLVRQRQVVNAFYAAFTMSATGASRCWLPTSVACGGNAPADTRPYCARSWPVSCVTTMHVCGSGRR